jgi:hypothetical protein
MKHRANILARLRRSKAGRARPIVGLFAVAYLSAGLAPCAAASQATGEADLAVREHAAADESHAGHQSRDDAAHSSRVHAGHGAIPATHNTAPPAERGGDLCPHCPPALEAAAGIAHGTDHSSCAALEGLTNVAAAHAKDFPAPAVPLLASAPFTLPPPLASPVAAPLHAVRFPPSVPLNVRHCVFLI